MNRRQFAVSLPVAGLLLGCATKPAPSPPATGTKLDPSRPSTALGNADVRAALKAHELAIRNLEVNTDRLGDESWLDVVPDVEGAARDVRNSFESLRKALGALGY
jgi:hypothetical protein